MNIALSRATQFSYFDLDSIQEIKQLHASLLVHIEFLT